MRRYRKVVSKGIRKSLIKEKTSKNDYFPDCPYCDTPFYIYESHADHMEPISRGGPNTIKNIILVCISCNVHKKDSPFTKWIIEQTNHSPEYFEKLLILNNKRIPSDLENYLCNNLG